VKWFGTAIFFVACFAVRPAVYGQQPRLASPSVSDRACAFAEADTVNGTSNLASTTSTTAPTSVQPRGVGSLSVRVKLLCYAKVSYSAGSFIWPGVAASKKMILPPQTYPSEWKQGIFGFGRNYGDALANDTANRGAKYASAILLHEDTRYWPSADKSVFRRVIYAISFALVDRSDSGMRRLAVSNLAGAAAGGFVGNAYLPRGYDDVTHAGQRSAIQLAESPLPNLVCEFTPEFRAALTLAHLGLLNSSLLGKCAR
jgi:hypothetical protein